MDPEACWVRLKEAIVDGDQEEAEGAAWDLARWVRAGGFLPKDLQPQEASEERIWWERRAASGEEGGGTGR